MALVPSLRRAAQRDVPGTAALPSSSSKGEGQGRGAAHGAVSARCSAIRDFCFRCHLLQETQGPLKKSTPELLIQ